MMKDIRGHIPVSSFNLIYFKPPGAGYINPTFDQQFIYNLKELNQVLE